QAAYTELSLEEAERMMLLKDRAEFERYVGENRPDWVIAGGKVVFQREEASKKSAEIKSMRLISECLSYATELERIV
ncbi:unnamed protein product, partial [Discosporangium mesarthrocarpum]